MMESNVRQYNITHTDDGMLGEGLPGLAHEVHKVLLWRGFDIIMMLS
jgi:hypothetical protein